MQPEFSQKGYVSNISLQENISQALPQDRQIYKFLPLKINLGYNKLIYFSQLDKQKLEQNKWKISWIQDGLLHFMKRRLIHKKK